MKILFYLPAVTPWWFETIITPMLRALHAEAALHVIVAPLWLNTGLETRHVEPLADLPSINWHIVQADDPAQFRLDGAAVEGLLDLVNAIDPDITLARSADRATPALFPGMVRHIMEPGAEPFHSPHRWFILDEAPFHHGLMPDDVAAEADHAAAVMAPFWQAIDAAYTEPNPGLFREKLGLPEDRPVLAIPLQYEHEENIYGRGSPLQHGADLIRVLLEHLDPRIILAITDHPLNVRFTLRTELDRIAAEYPDRVRLHPIEDGCSPTNLVIRAADAVLVDRSKCVSLAAFFGTPVVHIGDSLMADWMNATPLEAVTAEVLLHRGLPTPDNAAARRWFGWHFGMRLVEFKAVTLDILKARIFHSAGTQEIDAMLAFLAPWQEAAVKAAEVAVNRLTDKDDGQIAA